MAGTTTKSRPTAYAGSDVRDGLVQYNALVADVEILRAGLAALAAKFNAVLAKLDADAGVTDTNYTSTQAAVVTTYDAASDLTAAKIGNGAGVALA